MAYPYEQDIASAAVKRPTMSDIGSRLDEIEKLAQAIKSRTVELNSRVNGGGELEGVSDERERDEPSALIPRLSHRTGRIHDLLQTISDRLGNVEAGLN